MGYAKAVDAGSYLVTRFAFIRIPHRPPDAYSAVVWSYNPRCRPSARLPNGRNRVKDVEGTREKEKILEQWAHLMAF
jgi:hypothetical protein